MKESKIIELKKRVEGLTGLVRNLVQEVHSCVSMSQGTLTALQLHLGKEEWDKIVEELKDREKRLKDVEQSMEKGSKGVDYPEWGDNEVYKKTIGGGYLYNGETPKEAYQRVSKTVAKRLFKPEMADVFFEYIWKGWLCLASPVLSNTGTDRGLPISCFGIDVADSIIDIGQKNLEMMLLAKHGGGVGIGINQIRPAGAKITGNGTSDGVVPFCKIYDSTILATNQGSVRRGAASVNINIDHPDFEEWLEIREPKGDINRQSLNLHQCADFLKVTLTNKIQKLTKTTL
jgi:ribonucleotide reductase alpha subunit